MSSYHPLPSVRHEVTYRDCGATNLARLRLDFCSNKGAKGLLSLREQQWTSHWIPLLNMDVDSDHTNKKNNTNKFSTIKWSTNFGTCQQLRLVSGYTLLRDEEIDDLNTAPEDDRCSIRLVTPCGKSIRRKSSFFSSFSWRAILSPPCSFALQWPGYFNALKKPSVLRIYTSGETFYTTNLSLFLATNGIMSSEI